MDQIDWVYCVMAVVAVVQITIMLRIDQLEKAVAVRNTKGAAR